jgi:uncharacterized RDD family membrane protein YckC
VNQPPGYGPPPGYPAGPGYLPPPAPPLSPAGVPLAGFDQRLLAYMIDIALLSAVSFVVAIPAVFVVLGRITEAQQGRPVVDVNDFVSDYFMPLLLLEVGLFALLLVLYYVYVVEFMHRTGQTVGKKAMKIRVVPIDPSRRLTRGMAAKRYLIEYVVGTIVPFFSWVDGLWQLWDKPYQQTLHDKVAQTVVVKVLP